jgi:chromosome segregation ATPase
MEESIPANWMYMWATREEAALALRKQNNDQLDTVQKAIPYLQENIQVHVDVLRQKQAFINEHEAEVPGLVKECTRLAKEATNIKSEVINLIRKLERGKERDKPKTTKKIISLILKQRENESNHDVATGKLALFTPDSPGVVTGLPAFPSSRYNLPRWLQSKLERIRR